MISTDQLKKKYCEFSNEKLSQLLFEFDSLTPEAQIALKEVLEIRELDEGSPIEPQCSETSKLYNLERAGLLTRFIGFIIDRAALFLFSLTFFILGDYLSSITSFINIYLILLFFLSFPIFNYIYLEGKYGKTIGKFINKTHVLNIDGTKIGYIKAIQRTILRLVPLGVFFIFVDENIALHDRFTKTYVTPD